MIYKNLLAAITLKILIQKNEIFTFCKSLIYLIF